MGLKEAFRSLFTKVSFNGKKIVKNDVFVDHTNPGYELLRQIYRNQSKDFSLGNFSQTIIDTTIGFLGVPDFQYDKDNDDALEYLMKHHSIATKLHTTTLVEAKAYLRITFIEGDIYNKAPRFEFEVLGQDRVRKIVDRKGNLAGFEVYTTIQYDMNDSQKTYMQVEQVYPEKTIIQRKEGAFGGLPATEEIINRFGVVPIIEFVNDPDHNGIGVSDLRSAVPFMGMYHDIMVQLRRITQLHSNPFIKIQVGDYDKFKKANPALFDENDNIILDNVEVIFQGQGDDINYVKLEASIDGLTKLLEYVFYCVIQTSRTPEFLMGTAIASSKASASEQMAIMEMKIDRKRKMLNDTYIRVADVFQQMWKKVNGSYGPALVSKIQWSSIDLQNPDLANNAKSIVDALDKALQRELITKDEAALILNKYLR